MKLKTSKPPMKLQELEEARDRLLELSKIQAEAREEELQIREYLADKLYPKDKEEGATTITVEGIKLSITRVLNYTIGKDDAELLQREQPKLAAEVLNWSPKVRVAAFKDHQKELAKFVTVKPGPSTVTFK